VPVIDSNGQDDLNVTASRTSSGRTPASDSEDSSTPSLGAGSGQNACTACGVGFNTVVNGKTVPLIDNVTVSSDG